MNAMRKPLGWDYPAGAESDPAAPWNTKHYPPQREYENDDDPALLKDKRETINTTPAD